MPSGQGRLFPIEGGILLAIDSSLYLSNSTCLLSSPPRLVMTGGSFTLLSLEHELYLMQSLPSRLLMYRLLPFSNKPSADLFGTFKVPFILVSIVLSVCFQVKRQK